MKTSPRGLSWLGHQFLEVGGGAGWKPSDWGNEPPVMLMMLARLASIISIIGLRFTNLEVSGCSMELGQPRRRLKSSHVVSECFIIAFGIMSVASTLAWWIFGLLLIFRRFKRIGSKHRPGRPPNLPT